jgi:Ca2+-transporting ATPase
MISLSLLQGGSVALIVLAVFALALGLGRGEAEARALTFTTLVVGNLSLIVAIRSRAGTVMATLRRPTRALGSVLGGALLLLGLVLYVPALADLFQFVPLSVGDLGLAVVAGLASVLWLKGVEILRQRRMEGVRH